MKHVTLALVLALGAFGILTPHAAAQNDPTLLCIELRSMTLLGLVTQSMSPDQANTIATRERVACAAGIEAAETEYWENGGVLRSGETWYYPNGGVFSTSTTTYYPNGGVLASGETWYYPNGGVMWASGTWYLPNGGVSSESGVLAFAAERLSPERFQELAVLRRNVRSSFLQMVYAVAMVWEANR